ncbi:glutathione S-transferase F8, chloroplastic-like [Phalaenopsis equestris]|uniref:glutathione S-transferase F8, chloroplastic-like n=1 Tax=Phalaenopsis equestris TaxID=78828 RepID=UPI0009E42AFE|nr:glutathione S-transferase F8, chloroplastic-like [Phalaenopsis equestris]
MSSVQVFGSPASAEVARVLACLFEKEVEFQLIRTDTYKGKQRRPDYLKLQPSGESLTYEDGKTTIVDSRAICLHVADTYAEQGNKDLLGRGRLERASIEQWLRTESQIFDPPSSTLVFYLAFAPLQGIEKDEEEVQKSKKELEKVLDIYDKRLNEMNFLAGDKFTLADLAHLPNTHRLMTMVPECADMFKERPNVMKWWEAISGRPKWIRVVDLQKEAPAVA